MNGFFFLSFDEIPSHEQSALNRWKLQKSRLLHGKTASLSMLTRQ